MSLKFLKILSPGTMFCLTDGIVREPLKYGIRVRILTLSNENEFWKGTFWFFKSFTVPSPYQAYQLNSNRENNNFWKRIRRSFSGRFKFLFRLVTSKRENKRRKLENKTLFTHKSWSQQNIWILVTGSPSAVMLGRLCQPFPFVKQNVDPITAEQIYNS